MINTNEIIDDIFHSTISALTDGYVTEKILITQEVYDVFKKENCEILGEDNGDFDELLVYPVEISNEIENYMVIVKEINL